MWIPEFINRAVRVPLLCCLAGLGVHAANRPCTCLTYNVCAFPPKTRDALKALSGLWNKIKGREGDTDLGGNCNMGITDRLKLDGQLYAQFKPDVIAVQECWKSDCRDLFIKSLPPGYHITLEPLPVGEGARRLELAFRRADSGLFHKRIFDFLEDQERLHRVKAPPT